MNLEDMSTKDLERLYHKHFGKAMDKADRDTQLNANIDEDILVVPSPYTLRTDAQNAALAGVRRITNKQTYAPVPEEFGGPIDPDYQVEGSPGGLDASELRDPGFTPEEAEASNRQIHEKWKQDIDYGPHKSLESLSTKDLRNLYLKSLRIKHKKSNEGVNDIRRAEERTANSPTDVLGNRSRTPNTHAQGKIAQDFHETPRKGRRRVNGQDVPGDIVRAQQIDHPNLEYIQGEIARIGMADLPYEIELIKPTEGGYRRVSRTDAEIKHPIEDIQGQ